MEPLEYEHKEVRSIGFTVKHTSNIQENRAEVKSSCKTGQYGKFLAIYFAMF